MRTGESGAVAVIVALMLPVFVFGMAIVPWAEACAGTGTMPFGSMRAAWADAAYASAAGVNDANCSTTVTPAASGSAKLVE